MEVLNQKSRRSTQTESSMILPPKKEIVDDKKVKRQQSDRVFKKNDVREKKSSYDELEAFEKMIEKVKPKSLDDINVPIRSLDQHIESLHKSFKYPDTGEEVSGWDFEHSFLNNEEPVICSCAMRSENISKNRYKNVLPPDQSRVKLEDSSSDYINANFVDPFVETSGSEKLYVASQSPMTSTITDFWKMIWQLRARVIAMLTKEIENGRVKADRYWPIEKNQGETFGEFEIILHDQIENQKSIERTLILRNLKLHKRKKLTMMQYLQWPDHGAPENVPSFLQFMNRVDEINSKKHAPLIILCSAGVGRTGSYITIHSVLDKVKRDLIKHPEKEPTINIPKTIRKMRRSRPGLVENLAQFKFCYMAISEGLKQMETQKVK